MAYAHWYIVDGLALFAILAIGCAYLSTSRNTPRLPPGPKPWPILGNIFDIPKTFVWVQYQRWAALYGDVFTLTIFGNVIIVLNSHTAVEDIVLRERPSIFSSRPSLKFADIVGEANRDVAMMPYGKRWRERRRIIDRSFQPASVQIFQSVLQEKTTIAMSRITQNPEHFVQHLTEYTGAVILSMVYGYDVENASDKLIETAQEYSALIIRTLLPGQLIVNTLPFLSWLPPWTLGSEYVQLMKEIVTLGHDIAHKPFEWAKGEVEKGTAKKSLVRQFLGETSGGDVEAELMHIETFGVVYGAASGTTVAALSTFVLAMMLYPDVQTKAQLEIDAVIERGRLPTFEDRRNLPYIDALIMEILRWRPVAPQGVPHAASEDFTWGGYHIPKGATIIANTWAILHDPTSYPEPETLKPERFLSRDGQVIGDPKLEYVFGFGVRRCPGRYLEDSTLWIFITTMLSKFSINQLNGAEETEIGRLYGGEGMVMDPLPFGCRIAERNIQLEV